MEENRYIYYRAGVPVGRFSISPDAIRCRVRSFETLMWQAEEPFSMDMAPFDRELDLRLPETLACVQRGAFDTARYEKSCQIEAEIQGERKRGTLWAQREGHFPLDVLTCDGRIAALYDNERNYIGLLVREGYEAMTPQAAFSDPLLSKGNRGMKKLGGFMVPMRDGVCLATNVFLPADYRDGERLPTVLVRTCYGKDSAKQFFVFTHYGYAVAAQDTRGREESEGCWQPIVNEMDDGDDTLDWISGQSWSDGRVGMIGASYLAIVQWAAAASGNPHLKALISMVTGGVPIFDFPHRGGVLSPGTIAWAFAMRKKSYCPRDMLRKDWSQILRTRPIRDIPKKGIGEDIPFWDEWMDHEFYDEYWHRANWMMRQHQIDVPSLYISGWYDDVGGGTMQMWDMNRRNGRRNQKMVIGAWKHKMNVSRDIHGICYGADSLRYDLFPLYLRWYDRHLKGIPNHIEDAPPVEYYIIGEGAWRNADDWPPPETKMHPLYLQSGGNANTSLGDGMLSWQRPERACEDCFAFDPQNPAPFLIDVSENECMVPENYRDVELRQDVLVYTSAPLEQDLVIAGEPVAVLYAASDAKDTDWVVRLTDVDEMGNSIRMCDGIVRARFRKSFIEPKLLLPGEVVRYEIPLTWIAGRFQKGHRLRVEVGSGADYSVFPNPNTGHLMADETEWVIANQTVYSGGMHPSHILIPVFQEGPNN